MELRLNLWRISSSGLEVFYSANLCFIASDLAQSSSLLAGHRASLMRYVQEISLSNDSRTDRSLLPSTNVFT